MSLQDLVQVGSDMWLDPANIVGVRWVPESTILSQHFAGYTQFIHTAVTMFGPSTTYLSSDWPLDRVQAALGLVSADELDKML